LWFFLLDSRTSKLFFFVNHRLHAVIHILDKLSFTSTESSLV
jgi:hypothetical protein